MEPSLRSSAARGNECKLRRTDPALHETTKRFVESLCPDVRISQYADLNFAARKFENDTWYWLEPVAGGKVGYLVFLTGQPVVWIDDQLKNSYRIQMRVSFSVYDKGSVLIASINKTDCLLRLEDVWHLCGKSYLNNSFTQRWNELIYFYNYHYKSDTQLQQGLRIEMATYQSLESVKNWSPLPNMMFAQGEMAPRRLRVQFAENEKQGQKQEQKQGQKPMFVDDAEDHAQAVAHDEYPDTYNITMKGVSKGYAAVQNLSLSRVLREASKNNKEITVQVSWNSEFNMYEIIGLV